MKLFKLFILTLVICGSFQGCSYLSQKWDERPTWMGGEEQESAKEVPSHAPTPTSSEVGRTPWN